MTWEVLLRDARGPQNYSEDYMRKFVLIVSLFASSHAIAETAIWTGNKEKIDTIGGQTKWKCEYKVANRSLMILFWREFFDFCPDEVEY